MAIIVIFIPLERLSETANSSYTFNCIECERDYDFKRLMHNNGL